MPGECSGALPVWPGPGQVKIPRPAQMAYFRFGVPDMALNRFQDFLWGLIAPLRRRRGERLLLDEALRTLMGSRGEVSTAVAAREVLDSYKEAPIDDKLAFFRNLEQNFNADFETVKAAWEDYEQEPSSANLSRLSRQAEPRRLALLRRLHQTPNATHDLVAMRAELLDLLPRNPELRTVDEEFQQVLSSWFGRGFLVLRKIDWSTSAAILERIIRYEAVHEILDWQALRKRIQPANRCCYAFFHPSLTDEPLIFVEVALTAGIPSGINEILENGAREEADFTTAVFYSISNCQPGLKRISFGNFLIKQVVLELRAAHPSIETFVTLSPVPGFGKWLESGDGDGEDAALLELRSTGRERFAAPETAVGHEELLRRLVFGFLLSKRRGMYPLDPVARFHFGNGASLHRVVTGADLSDNGWRQSRGVMVNYLYDQAQIESNHEQYIQDGTVRFSDRLKSLRIRD